MEKAAETTLVQKNLKVKMLMKLTQGGQIQFKER